MLKNIIDLLNTDDWYMGDPDIDFAKGKYEAPRTMKELKDKIKRGTYGKEQRGIN
jgi:hypothetical protein